MTNIPKYGMDAFIFRITRAELIIQNLNPAFNRIECYYLYIPIFNTIKLKGNIIYYMNKESTKLIKIKVPLEINRDTVINEQTNKSLSDLLSENLCDNILYEFTYNNEYYYLAI